MSAPSGRRETKREKTERMLAQRAAEQAAQRPARAHDPVGAAVAVACRSRGCSWRSRGGDEAPDDAALPTGVDTAGGGVPVGRPKHRSSSCTRTSSARSARFEDALALADLVSAGTARIVYYPLSFLDRQLGNDSSLRRQRRRVRPGRRCLRRVPRHRLREPA